MAVHSADEMREQVLRLLRAELVTDGLNNRNCGMTLHSLIRAVSAIKTDKSE